MKYSISRQFEKNRELQADNFVLVYQMGKVGSSSIEHTLGRKISRAITSTPLMITKNFTCITIKKT